MTHGLARTGLVERFGKTHPEYFALLPNGQRDNRRGRHRGQLCLMNPALQNEVFLDAVSYLKGEPASARGILTMKGKSDYDLGAFAPGFVSVMPQDGFGERNSFSIERSAQKFGMASIGPRVWMVVAEWSPWGAH